jgi:hypothetical protein
VSCTHLSATHFFPAWTSFAPLLHIKLSWAAPFMVCTLFIFPLYSLTHHIWPITMQDSTSPSPSLPPAPSVRSSVALSAKLPYPKRSNATISDAQRKAVRIFASETRPRPTQKACTAWFYEKFGRVIDRTTVSRTLSSQYSYLDNGEAGTKSRKSTAHWPLLDKALFQWQQRHAEKGFPITGPLIRLKAAEYWKKIPMYKDQTMPTCSDGWLTGFKRRYSIK